MFIRLESEINEYNSTHLAENGKIAMQRYSKLNSMPESDSESELCDQEMKQKSERTHPCTYNQ